MEAAQIKVVSQRLLRQRAQPADLDHAEHVGGRLRGPGDVAIDLVLDIDRRPARVGHHVVHGLLPGPAQRMQAAVHHQTRGTRDLVGVKPNAIQRGGVEPQLIGEAL